MPMHSHLRLQPAVAAAVVGAMSLVPLVSACGSDGPRAEVPATTAATADTTSSTSTSTSTIAEVSTSLPTTDPAGEGSGPSTAAGAPGGNGGADSDRLPDGTNFGYLTAIGIADRTVTIDIAELLDGDAAVKAAIEDGALEPGETSIANDYYVRNRNPKLRTLSVAPTAPVNVLPESGPSGLIAGSLVNLAEALTADLSDDGPVLPVQIVVAGGVITRIDEVFFP